MFRSGVFDVHANSGCGREKWAIKTGGRRREYYKTQSEKFRDEEIQGVF